MISLLPQSIGPKLAERSLDASPRLRILRDAPPCKRRPAQQAQLAAEEQTAGREEGVGRDVAQRRRLQQRRDVRDRFCRRQGEIG